MKSGGIGIRLAFRIAILVLATLAFLGIVSISYVNTTASSLADSEAAIRSEVNYLCLQIESLDERTEAFMRIVDSTDASPQELEAANPEDYRLMVDSVGELLSGYTLAETGTVAIAVDDKVIATDDARLPVGSNIRELLGDEMSRAIDTCLQNGQMQHISDAGVLAETDAIERDAYLLAKQQSGRTVVIVEPSGMVFQNRDAVIWREAITFLCILVIVFLIVDRLLAFVVARRIDKTNEALARITEGDLDVRVEDKGTREFKSLSAGVNKMVDALKSLIAEAETRMDAELDTARAIQEAALPQVFPPFPDVLKFDIYASMDPARQVGGDFYDFFLLDGSDENSGKLVFGVADVSGKGVPGALFMMKAKALISDYAKSGLELDEAISEANRQICDGNDADMFVTAWVGVLDYGTGRVTYVNAGHNPPLLWNYESGWQWIRQKSGPPLGLFELPYTAQTVECMSGDTFLLYTDGVTEALDVNQKLYGDDRLLAVAEENFVLHPRDLVKTVRADVAAYAEGAEQSDDITILALEVGVPPEVTSVLKVPAETSQLDSVIEFLHDELDRRLCPKRVQNQLDLVVEELFVNVCSYAYPNATSENPGEVFVQRTYNTEPPHVTVDIIDTGIAFNPLDRPEAEKPQTIDDAPIAGRGLLIAKNFVDEISYERKDDKNMVTIVKKW